MKRAITTTSAAAMALVCCAWASVSTVDAAFLPSELTRRVFVSSNGQQASCSVSVGSSVVQRSTSTLPLLLLLSANEDSFDQADAASSSSSRNINNKNQYKLPSDAGPIASTCKLTEGQIHYLISKRSDCKRDRNFAEADYILETLKKAGVYLHDKRQEWRADGNNHFGRTSGGNRRHRPYVQRGGTHGQTDAVMAEIATMVELRAQAKRKKDFFTSDELSAKLKRQYGVHINDKQREWSLSFIDEGEEVVSVYVPSPIVPQDDPTHTMEDETKALIQKRLTDRLVARRSKEYDLADSILHELQEEHSVVIDDRTREWKVVSADENDRFIKEAQASQRSAFVRSSHNNDDLLLKENVSSESSSISDDDSDVDAAFSAIFDDDDDPIEENDAMVLAEEAPEEAPTEEEETESQGLMTLTIPLLKEKLRDAGLPVSGKKADLVERLLVGGIK